MKKIAEVMREMGGNGKGNSDLCVNVHICKTANTSGKLKKKPHLLLDCS